jgi:hypothetical protein
MAANAGVILLWVFIIIIIVIIIVWVTCECMRRKPVVKGKVVTYGDGKNSRYGNKENHAAMGNNNSSNNISETSTPDDQEFRSPLPARPMSQAPVRQMEQPPAAASGAYDHMEQPFAMGSSSTPMAYHPWGAANSGKVGPGSNAYARNWPTEEDPAARYPRNPGDGPGGNGNVPSPDETCNAQNWGYHLNVDHLMPASWRGPEQCGVESEDTAEWAKYAPSKEAFDRYITASGSARLGVNTRSSMARQIGIPNLLRGGAPMPLSTYESQFLDSDNRQSLIFSATGQWPSSTNC